MPIIKSAKKRVATIRNFVFRRRLHDVQNVFYELIKEKKFKDAEAQLSKVYKVIDTCDKKNILHKNTAARLKAKAARGLASIAPKTKTAAPKTKPAAKKAA